MWKDRVAPEKQTVHLPSFFFIKDSNVKRTNMMMRKSRKGIRLSCQKCNKIFYAKVRNVKYCKKCRTVICKYCNNSFIVGSYAVDGNTYNPPKKYCSSDCYHKDTRGKLPVNKGKQVVLVCGICGDNFSVPIRRKNAKYCSLECKHMSRTRVTGKDHPLWKGGVLDYRTKVSKANGSIYVNRKKALKRDNYRCRYCGGVSKFRNVDTHHIVSIRKGGSNELGNLICLCVKHHILADNGHISEKTLFTIIKLY